MLNKDLGCNINIYIQQCFNNTCRRFIGMPNTAETRCMIENALKDEAGRLSYELGIPVEHPDLKVSISFES